MQKTPAAIEKLVRTTKICYRMLLTPSANLYVTRHTQRNQSYKIKLILYHLFVLFKFYSNSA